MASVYRKIFVTLVMLSFGLAAAAQQGPPPAAPVVVGEARMVAMAPSIWAAATVVSLDDAAIAAEVDGRLLSVAQEGTRLAKGDVLARLDDVLIKAALVEAEADVAREEANLTFLQREMERLQRLALQNNAAQTQLEQTISQRDASQYALAAAKARRLSAQERLARTILRAPFTGVVVQRAKRAGEWVNSGDEVARLVDHERLEIEAAAPAALRPYLAPGQSLAIQADERKGTALLKTVVPVADESSRLLRLRLETKGGTWLAGEPVKVALPTALPQKVLAVPRDALVLRRSGSYLFKVDAESKAQQVWVEIGVADAEFIQVMGELVAGDQVVIRGNERLRPGQPVSIKAGAAQ